MTSLADTLLTPGPATFDVQIPLPHDQAGQRLLVRSNLPEDHRGTGGYGTVLRGRADGRGLLALKILHFDSQLVAPNCFQRAERTVLREYAVGRKLTHPNLAEVHCIGKVQDERGGRLCVVAEFVEGRELREAGPDTWGDDKRCAILLQIAAGLEALHLRGIVHRDLSSRSVMVSADGSVKILDFGISFFLHTTLSSLSLPLALADRDTDPQADKPRGNPAYLAPEQWLPVRYEGPGGPRFDGKAGLFVPMPESDVFALGVIGFELFSGGRHPFGRIDMSSAEMRSAICARPLRPRWPTSGAVPGAVRRLVERCLRERPQDRPAVGAIRSEIAAICAPRQEVVAAPDPSVASSDPQGEIHSHEDWDACTLDEYGRCTNQ
jgi:serine/threonine protein kinase